MKIGLANIYSFRPHVEHLAYLGHLLRRAGHETIYLTCDSDVDSCYPRLLKGTGRIRECATCVLGGIRSFSRDDVFSLSNIVGREVLPPSTLRELAFSSAASLVRSESAEDYNSSEFLKICKRLEGPINTMYGRSRAWISEQRIDAVICFNGRMDLTRALTYACEGAGVPYLTHERTWFGDGIRLIPNQNCLSLQSLARLVSEFSPFPLTDYQAKRAGKLVASRFLQRNSLEWRLYNPEPINSQWPTHGNGPRILILPSSKNEFAGHAEWVCGWDNNTDALDDFLDFFKTDISSVVLRCHPNWAESIGRVTGERSRNHYYSWAARRGIFCVRSDERVSTYDLIREADIVILNGGSSAVEAGVCGKKVVCLGPSAYQTAGFCRTYMAPTDLGVAADVDNLSPAQVVQNTLRYVYSRYGRFPQFVDYVRARSTTSYEYFEGGDGARLIEMLRSGDVMADDAAVSDSTASESDVVGAALDGQWEFLMSFKMPEKALEPLAIQRRPGFRWIDGFRAKFPRGDRM